MEKSSLKSIFSCLGGLDSPVDCEQCLSTKNNFLKGVSTNYLAILIAISLEEREKMTWPCLTSCRVAGNTPSKLLFCTASFESRILTIKSVVLET